MHGFTTLFDLLSTCFCSLKSIATQGTMLDGLRGAAFFCFDSKYELARHIQNQIERSVGKFMSRLLAAIKRPKIL